MLPKIIDLFSGCGGLTLGFEKAGFKIAAGIEIVPEACQTITYNLDYRYGKEPTHICGDITETDASEIRNTFGKEGCIVIGGPPCQAYSIAGRAKLRSLGGKKDNTDDKRGYLYQDFLRFIYDLEARAVVMENVPESTDFGGMNIPEIVCDSLESHGYNAFWTILNAADFGVPQVRERVFVLAIKKEENRIVELPSPSHKSSNDYRTRNQKRLESFNEYSHFNYPLSSTGARKKWISVEEAFSDLPELFSDPGRKYKMSRLNEEMDYKTEPANNYQKKMRGWYGYQTESVTANAFRNTKKDFELFARMKPGDNYLDASAIADEMFKKEAELFGYKPGTAEYQKLYEKMVPVYDRNNFDYKWKRLDPQKPSHTLIAHLSKDTYSFIHPYEPRGISVREAARLQSFPDDFFFSCNMGEAFRQIGNAVPPLLALAVAKKIKEAFKEV